MDFKPQIDKSAQLGTYGSINNVDYSGREEGYTVDPAKTIFDLAGERSKYYLGGKALQSGAFAWGNKGATKAGYNIFSAYRGGYFAATMGGSWLENKAYGLANKIPGVKSAAKTIGGIAGKLNPTGFSLERVTRDMINAPNSAYKHMTPGLNVTLGGSIIDTSKLGTGTRKGLIYAFDSPVSKSALRTGTSALAHIGTGALAGSLVGAMLGGDEGAEHGSLVGALAGGAVHGGRILANAGFRKEASALARRGGGLAMKGGNAAVNAITGAYSKFRGKAAVEVAEEVVEKTVSAPLGASGTTVEALIKNSGSKTYGVPNHTVVPDGPIKKAASDAAEAAAEKEKRDIAAVEARKKIDRAAKKAAGNRTEDQILGAQLAAKKKAARSLAKKEARKTIAKKVAGKAMGFALGVVNVASWVDTAISIPEGFSDYYAEQQLSLVKNYESSQQSAMNSQSSQAAVVTNMKYAQRNDQELSFLLSRKNLARDESYRYSNANYGF